MLREEYEYPVSSHVVFADSEDVEHIDVLDVNAGMIGGAMAYEPFLLGALGEDTSHLPEFDMRSVRWMTADGEELSAEEVHGPGHSHDHSGGSAPHREAGEVSLTPEEPTATLLDVFRSGGAGKLHYTVYDIDTTAFESGGTLEITVTVGGSQAAGAFDLFGEGRVLPTSGTPESLARAQLVQPREKATLTYAFSKGQVFRLGATGSGKAATGATNAFLAEVRVAN